MEDRLHKVFFESDSYDTPYQEKLGFLKKLLSHNQVFFTLNYINIVLRTRKKAITGRYDDKEWAESSYNIFKFIEKTGGRFHISGMEYIAESPEPVVFIGNHMSTLETMILPVIIVPHRRVTYVVKESLVRNPIFRDIMRSRDPIVVGRKDPRKDFETVMNRGMELLSKDMSIIIFPQSTRSTEFKPEEFNTLGVKLAKKAGVKIVPIALKTDFWGQGRIIKELGRVDSSKPIYIKFGEPFYVKGSGKDENQRVIDFIATSLEKWKNIL
jgi:1-acyl-sn-glycerol-3-phosphate acyltransferase